MYVKSDSMSIEQYIFALLKTLHCK